ncbi:unnamed protein product [Euphydryas editha]|uniref:Uncharacterized protein n=1 Tax=Euphydryas editha TaxID=104508 RepID=A0AAU9UNU8_EUPED|nr:unnamed protein product [Euphydryas editha]
MSRQYEFSNVEYLAMVQLYAIANYNLEKARRLYSQPEHLNTLRLRGIESPQISSTPTILAATQRLLDYGQFRAPTHAQGQGRLNYYSPEFEEDVLEYFERDPRRSTRMAAREFDVSQTFVWKILHTQGLHPYHFRKAHVINNTDAPARIAFCQWLLNNTNANILWTDESLFTRVGLYNVHNEHYWDLINPHLIRENHHQVRFSVNVWAGIINDQLIGPIFIEGHLTGNSYLEMLRTVISELVDDVPLAYSRVETLKKCVNILEYRRSKPVIRKSRGAYDNLELSRESSLNDLYHAQCYKLFTAIKIPRDFQYLQDQSVVEHDNAPEVSGNSSESSESSETHAPVSGECSEAHGTVDSLSTEVAGFEDSNNSFSTNEPVAHEDSASQTCFICQKQRKRHHGREVRLAVNRLKTIESLKNAASEQNDVQMLEKLSSFSDDTKIPYHKCCKNQYLRDIYKDDNSEFSKKKKVTNTAYTILCEMLEETVVKNSESFPAAAKGRDECSAFGVLVAKKLRRLSKERRDIMMAKIHQLFIDEHVYNFSLSNYPSSRPNYAATMLSYTPSSPQINIASPSAVVSSPEVAFSSDMASRNSATSHPNSAATVLSYTPSPPQIKIASPPVVASSPDVAFSSDMASFNSATSHSNSAVTM